VPHAFGAQSRNLAGGENDQRAITFQMLLNGFQIFARCIATHVVHRQQEWLQRLYSAKNIVGDHFDIGPNFTDQLDQRKPIEGADGVIGNNDHFATGRDTFAFVVAGGIGELEVIQYLFDEIEPAQVGIGLGELLKLLLMTKQTENFDHGPGQDGTFVPEIRVAILDKGFNIEHGVLRDVAVNPSSAV